MRFNLEKNGRPRPDSLSPWVRRAHGWVLGLTVLLGLAFYIMLWFGGVDGPSVLDRVLLPKAEGGSSLNPFDLSGPKLLVTAVLAASVFVTWKVERRREDRFEVLVLLGVVLMIVGGLNGSEGAGMMRGRWPLDLGLRDPRLDLCLALVAIGSLFVLAGLVRIALFRERRGAVLGACALFTMLSLTWFLHHHMMAPFWAQPRTPPGYVVEKLAHSSASQILVYRTLKVDPDLIEIAERDGRAVCFASGAAADDSVLADHVEGLLAKAKRWNDRRFQRAGLEVFIRADVSLSAQQVIRVLDRCADSGAKRFELVTMKYEPFVTGRLELYAGGSEHRSVLEVRKRADGSLSFRLGGREATEVRALLPAINHPAVYFPDRQKIMVRVEPDLGWQEVVTTLEEVDWFRRQVSLGLLEDD